jgi:hypothetical protein
MSAPQPRVEGHNPLLPPTEQPYHRTKQPPPPPEQPYLPTEQPWYLYRAITSPYRATISPTEKPHPSKEQPHLPTEHHCPLQGNHIRLGNNRTLPQRRHIISEPVHYILYIFIFTHICTYKYVRYILEINSNKCRVIWMDIQYIMDYT